MDSYYMLTDVFDVVMDTLGIWFIPLLFGYLSAFIQLEICRSDRRVFSKLVPEIVLLILSGICVWLLWLWNTEEANVLRYVLCFVALIALVCMLLGCAVAWIIYFFGKMLKNRKNNL